MRVCVLGTGIMGSGIAQLAAMAGHDVRARDLTAEQLRRGAGAVDTSVARFVKKGRLTEDQAEAVVDRIAFTTDLRQAADGAEVVVESVTEVLEVKQEVIGEAARHAAPDALLGTNTSQLSITQVSSVLGEDAERFCGIHFFNPPVMMRLVELIAGLRTSAETVERARAFGESLNREVVVCRKDSPGFITSRVYAILRLECIRLVEEGVASAQDIDTAMKLGFNFPMGPLELGDMNGLDTYLHAIRGLEEAHGDRFHPTVGLKNMVAAGRLGRKSGAGFYEYSNNGSTLREGS
jgi:3-hydroxybutyryl-CoA dehydrogenase